MTGPTTPAQGTDPSGPTAARGPSGRRARLVSSASLISAATMVSRLLGLVREQLFAVLLGATPFADAFVVAYRIPNLLRDLFAEGALSQAFLPTFKATLKREGAPAAYALGNRVAGTLLVVLALLVAAGWLGAPAIVHAMAASFADTPGKFELTVLLTRIMLPLLGLVSLAAVAMGMLNAQDRYATPALSPAVYNIVAISVGVTLWLTVPSHTTAATVWSVAMVLGGAAMLLIQIPPLYRRGYRPRLTLDLRLRDPGLKKVALLMLPAVGGLAAVQINVFINTVFATQEPGAAAWLNYAFRFLHMPIGVFGVAVATVQATRFADAAADHDAAAMGDHVVEGLGLVAFLCLPATVGMVLLDVPIISLIYQHGAFRASDTAATAAALDLYSLGLVAYASVKVLAPGFYAAGKARIPMLASMMAVAGNVTLNIFLHPLYGYRILALGTALAATLNFAQLYAAFHRHVAPIRHRALVRHLVRIALASAVMGAAVWAARLGLEHVIASRATPARAVIVLVPVTLGVVVYALACAALRVEELDHYLARIRRVSRPRPR